jgi:hypothetical protein
MRDSKHRADSKPAISRLNVIVGDAPRSGISRSPLFGITSRNHERARKGGHERAMLNDPLRKIQRETVYMNIKTA